MTITGTAIGIGIAPTFITTGCLSLSTVSGGDFTHGTSKAPIRTITPLILTTPAIRTIIPTSILMIIPTTIPMITTPRLRTITQNTRVVP